jgi:hypothetical protein
LFTVDPYGINIYRGGAAKKRKGCIQNLRQRFCAASNNPPPESNDAGEFLDAAFSFLLGGPSKRVQKRKETGMGVFRGIMN